ncbi:hypothetical protein E3N88_12194 [Mikania micrantha]|uniref:FAR1 domain-containing protein n=1 Tax=Mikania micrantha TaxID=192012 RepID=A0A5N6P7S8_9ASTR|nr:hypothetical protein E3N88_12194 [Mikania micrantha]
MDSTLGLNTFDSLIASYNEESFVASQIEVHPINKDPIISVDEEHGYVPNLPLLREECYEIPSNGDIDGPFGAPRGQEVTTSEDVQQSRNANGKLVLHGIYLYYTSLLRYLYFNISINVFVFYHATKVENFEGCYTFLTPNGTKVWCPNKGCDVKPTVGATYGSWSDVLRMYKNYAECSGFSVRVGQTKKNKSDQVTHKYLRCNKAGRPQSKPKFDTLDESFMSVRNRSFQVTDCKAHISVQVIEATSTFVIYKFVECHNHPLVETYNRDFTKAGRKLSFSTKQFIHHMTLNNIGPTIAHRLQVSIKGDHQNVNGTPTDFKNFSQAIRLFIGELRHVFWADEISRKNYEVFGDVLAFDTTYYTNK